jgi:acetyl-CoA synthetase
MHHRFRCPRRRCTLIDDKTYRQMYERSVSDPDGFWAEQAEAFLSWSKPWERVANWDFNKVDIRWFEGGRLNACYNCLDRHLETRGDQVAILWEGDDPAVDKKITYRALHAEVCRLANALKARGVSKGDRVASTCR